MPGAPDRIALVTGAHKGIGFEVARAIATSGYVVLRWARNPTTGAVDGLTRERLDVRSVELDVMRMETISSSSARIEADFSRLDVLVNNAGIADRYDGWRQNSRFLLEYHQFCLKRCSASILADRLMFQDVAIRTSVFC
jgi:NAD(P)-dependent dehydrogenase (short-subunit alcohol dehydrogenase family)